MSSSYVPDKVRSPSRKVWGTLPPQVLPGAIILPEETLFESFSYLLNAMELGPAPPPTAIGPGPGVGPTAEQVAIAGLEFLQ